MAFEMTEQIRRRLTDDTLVWLTTVSPTGRPAPRLVWFLWTGHEQSHPSQAAGPAAARPLIVIYSQPDVAKLRHIEGNDRVTLNFNSDAHGGDAVVLAGRAEIAPEVGPPESLPGLLDKYADLLQAIGMSAQEFTGTYTVPIRVLPDHAWTIPA